MQTAKRTIQVLTLLALILPAISKAQPLEIGRTAPEISLTAPDGSVKKLSELRGKLVLIDFWASWCSPCRKENSNLVEVYSKYQNACFKTGKGFEIFSVSLDFKQNLWVSAIEKDNLIWPYHVSELKGWRSDIAKKYGIKAIPYNFLIDSNGVILEVNLRGERLKKALRKYRRWNLFSSTCKVQ